MFTMGIYGIYDIESNECLYIGCSEKIEQRYFLYHVPRLANGTHRRKDFSDWFRAQSSENPTYMRILEVVESVDDLNSREAFWFRKETPKYYGKIPSENEKWKYSQEACSKISLRAKERFLNTPQQSGWAPLIKKYGEERAKEIMSSGDFNSITGALAGKKNAGKSKSASHREALRKAALADGAVRITCPECQKVFRGKSGFGTHKTRKHPKV